MSEHPIRQELQELLYRSLILMENLIRCFRRYLPANDIPDGRLLLTNGTLPHMIHSKMHKGKLPVSCLPESRKKVPKVSVKRLWISLLEKPATCTYLTLKETTSFQEKVNVMAKTIGKPKMPKVIYLYRK